MDGIEEQPSAPKQINWRFQIHRFFIFFILVIIYLFVWFHRVSPAVVSLYMADTFHVDISDLGILSSIYFYPYGMMQPFCGLLADVFEPSILIGASAILSAIGNIICGASKSLALEKFGRFIVGLATSPTYVPICKLITKWFDIKHYHKLQGVLIAFGGIGSVIGQAPLAEFAEAYGWRWVFYGIAIITGALGVLVLVVVRSAPERFGYEPINGVPESHGEEEKPTLKQRCVKLVTLIWAIIRNADFWYIALFAFLDGGTRQNFIGMWASSWIVDVFGYTKVQSSRILIGSSVAVLVGSPLAAVFSDAIKTRKWSVLPFNLLGILICFVCCFGESYLQGKFWGLIALTFLFTVATGNVICIIDTWGREKFSKEMSGTSVGCTNFFTYVGSAVWQSISSAIIEKQPKIDGKAYSQTAYRNAVWWPGIACLVVSLLCPLFSKESNIWDDEKKEKEENKSTPLPLNEVSMDAPNDDEEEEHSDDVKPQEY